MPVYVFSCPLCNGVTELLLSLDDTAPRPCTTPDCQGSATLKISRVAVKYQSFGFTSTDNLVSDQRGKNFAELRRKAEEISER